MRHKIDKNPHKIPPKINTEKDYEKVPNWHQFPQIPPTPPKTPKSHQKGHPNDPEMEPVEQKVRIENRTPEIDPPKSQNGAKVDPKNRVSNPVPPNPPS